MNLTQRFVHSPQNCPKYLPHKECEFAHFGLCSRWYLAAANLESPTNHCDFRHDLGLNQGSSTFIHWNGKHAYTLQTIIRAYIFENELNAVSLAMNWPDDIAAHQWSMWNSAALLPNPISESNLMIAMMSLASQVDVHSMLAGHLPLYKVHEQAKQYHRSPQLVAFHGSNCGRSLLQASRKKLTEIKRKRSQWIESTYQTYVNASKLAD